MIQDSTSRWSLRATTPGVQPEHAQALAKPTLYLDYDGPLHPNAASIGANGTAFLSAPFHYHELFEHAPILDDIVGNTPNLQIVISSTWVMEFGLGACIARLPTRLGSKVTGATWCEETLRQLGHGEIDLGSKDLRNEWRRTSRHDQISAHARAFQIKEWIALDDQDARWPDAERGRLVLCDERDGLSRKLTQRDLERALTKLTGSSRVAHPA